jgi:hypothetical protein
MQIEALTLDPIGHFLQARHPAGVEAEVLEADRVRLARFRHHFPGRSLQTLGADEVEAYCSTLATAKAPPAEISRVRILCQDFVVFARREPQLGSGLLKLPDRELLPARDSHGAWLEERNARAAVPPTGVYQKPSTGLPWAWIGAGLLAIAGGFWALRHFG